MHCRARTAAAQFRRQIFLKMKQKVSNKAHVCDIHYFQLTSQKREDIALMVTMRQLYTRMTTTNLQYPIDAVRLDHILIMMHFDKYFLLVNKSCVHTDTYFRIL